MNHIKRYNTIQDLEDYLQEFFDKWKITDKSKIEYREYNKIYYTVLQDRILIEVEEYIMDKLYTDLLKSLKSIEKRMCQEIKIDISSSLWYNDNDETGTTEWTIIVKI